MANCLITVSIIQRELCWMLKRLDTHSVDVELVTITESDQAFIKARIDGRVYEPVKLNFYDLGLSLDDFSARYLDPLLQQDRHWAALCEFERAGVIA